MEAKHGNPERLNRPSLGTVLVSAVAFAAALAAAGPAAGSVKVDGPRILVETKTLRAVFERGVMTSLARASDGRELVAAAADGVPGVCLVYPFAETAGLGAEATDRFHVVAVNAHRAEFRIEAWDGDGVMAISDDPATGDLIVELGLFSGRPGVRSCRWLVSGIAPGLELVAPFFQGIRMPLEDPLIRNTFWNWPHRWEAGLAILQGADGGFWVHCRDTRFRFKNIQVGTPGDARCLGFDTDAYGPIDRNLSAGGLAWRVNVHDGDWTGPADEYKRWLTGAYGLAETVRPGWMNEIRLAVAWCPTDPAVLDALAKRIDPRRVLLHVTDFRTSPPSENYPDFTPSERGLAFVRKAVDMGFVVMPHYPALDLSATNPAYNGLRDFQYVELENKKRVGWTRRGEGPVPESHSDRPRHEGFHVNMRMHPGSAFWRSLLAENIRAASEAMTLWNAFLDVTMNIHNVDNALVESRTPPEGMLELLRAVEALGPGMVLTGEGRNEITFQRQAFGQIHLFKSWFENIEGLERLKVVPLGERLFGDLCRGFGYHRLFGTTDAEVFRLRMQLEQGAVPTIMVRGAADIDTPNPGIREMLDRAVRTPAP